MIIPPTHDGSPRFPKHPSPYHLLRKIASGRVGTVFEARGPNGERKAIKFLNDELCDSLFWRDAFRREADCGVRVRHLNVVAIDSLTMAGRPPFLVMEFLAGKSLDHLSVRPTSGDEFVRLLRDLLAGQQAAHAQRYRLGDIKPANIVRTLDGRYVHVDLGAAEPINYQRGPDDPLIGSPAFMAPELHRGEPADGRADLWATGATLFTLATGRAPFPTVPGSALKGQILSDNVCPFSADPLWAARVGLPLGLAMVIMRLLEKDPTRRYASAADALCDLDDL